MKGAFKMSLTFVLEALIYKQINECSTYPNENNVMVSMTTISMH